MKIGSLNVLGRVLIAQREQKSESNLFRSLLAVSVCAPLAGITMELPLYNPILKCGNICLLIANRKRHGKQATPISKED